MLILPGTVLLFSAELGDYDPEVHTPGYISEFHFIMDQTEELELAFMEQFKTCRYVSIIPHTLKSVGDTPKNVTHCARENKILCIPPPQDRISMIITPQLDLLDLILTSSLLDSNRIYILNMKLSRKCAKWQKSKTKESRGCFHLPDEVEIDKMLESMFMYPWEVQITSGKQILISPSKHVNTSKCIMYWMVGFCKSHIFREKFIFCINLWIISNANSSIPRILNQAWYNYC